MNSEELQQFQTEVQRDVWKRRDRLRSEAQRILHRFDRTIRVTSVRLAGSYARGEAREDSDIDLKVKYRGHLAPEAVASHLYGKLSGIGGTYDIVPVKL